MIEYLLFLLFFSLKDEFFFQNLLIIKRKKVLVGTK